ncbi:rab1 small GTP-binding protein [Trypanosoma cruzi]|nr:rab1 small GTP-binding protein [Trypanosoma cruzi]
MDNTFLSCGGENHRFTTTDRGAARQEQTRPFRGSCSFFSRSHYLPPVMAEAAFCLDLKASFFQVSLPRETRHLFGFCVEDGALVEPARLPMGYKASPEILQIVIGSCRGDDGGSAPLRCTSIGAYRRLDR